MGEANSIALDVLSPESTLCHEEVASVELPGTLGRFVVLKDHAPLISSLEKGEIVCESSDGRKTRFAILSGFVEVLDNHVIACVEI